MNIGLTQANNKSPNFGMALKIDKSATPIIKNRFLYTPGKDKDFFITTIKECAERQAKNPVDIFIKEDKGKLVAEVVDSEVGQNLGKPLTQCIYPEKERKLLDVGFILNAEHTADTLNTANEELTGLLTDIFKKR